MPHDRPNVLGRGAYVLVAGISLFSIDSAQAGAWTLGGGRLWLKQTAAYWQTDQKFASELDTELVFPDRGPVQVGNSIPFDPVTGGTFRSLGLITEAKLGVFEWLDVGGSFPLLWTDFNPIPVDTVDGRFGVGDALFKAQALAWREPRWVLAGRSEWKIPTGDFDPSIYAAPLTEGQTDLAFYGSTGLSLYPYGYANFEFGWKFRFENKTNRRHPGDEFLFQIEGGFDLPKGFLIKVAFDGLRGRSGSIQRFGTRTKVPPRRLFSQWAGLIWRSPDQTFVIDAMGRYLIAGEDFPAGWQFFFGFAFQVQLYES